MIFKYQWSKWYTRYQKINGQSDIMSQWSKQYTHAIRHIYLHASKRKERKTKPARFQQTNKYEISPKGAPLIYTKN